MSEVDPNMRNRPRPPPAPAPVAAAAASVTSHSPQSTFASSPRRQQQQQQQPNTNSQPPPPAPPISSDLFVGGSGGYDAQTAQRVRRWIESRTVTDVRDCRPFLNREIHRGFALKKTANCNDRSAPRL